MFKKIRYWLEFVGVATASRLVPLLPLSVLNSITWAISWPVFYLDRRSRQVAVANLAAAFGDRYTQKERGRIARRSMQFYGRSVLELFWSPRINQKNFPLYLRWHDEEVFQQFLRLKGNRAVIGLTIHFGNFEWGNLLFAFRGLGGHVLMQRFKNGRLTGLFQKLREASGHKLVTQEGSMVKFFKLVKQGSHVGMLTDLTLKMSEPGVLINTFGLWMWTTGMHGLLQSRTGVPILPFVTVPTRRGYDVRILEPIEFSASASTEEIAQTCWDRFEPVIRERPELWLWAYKHWRYRSPVDGDRYPFYTNRNKLFDAEFNKRFGTSVAAEADPKPRHRPKS
jgi:Kdo2-lipid IVA lauroyltransferase/acyltransferase